MPTKPLVLNETVSATNALLTSIAENIATIAAADSSNARLASLAKEIADEAKTVAMGATRAEVFDTTELMQNWLKDPENAGKLKIGDNLYIKDTNVPDYWVSNVLTNPNDEGYYYEYAQLEIGKVNLSNVVKTDADDADTVDSVFGMLEGTPKNISSANLASVVAQLNHTSKYEGEYTGDLNDITEGNYYVKATSSNHAPTTSGEYIIYTYLGASNNTLYQTAISSTGAQYSRCKWGSTNSAWYGWGRCDGFGATDAAGLASVVAGNMGVYRERISGGMSTSFKCTKGLVIYSNVGENHRLDLYVFSIQTGLVRIHDGNTNGNLSVTSDNRLTSTKAYSDIMFIGWN